MIDNTLRAKNINYENYGLETKKALLQYMSEHKQEQPKVVAIDSYKSYTPASNFNMIRLWGGGQYETNKFL
jgi:hypothetical protein